MFIQKSKSRKFKQISINKPNFNEISNLKPEQKSIYNHTASDNADVVADEFQVLNKVLSINAKGVKPVKSIILKIDGISIEPDDEMGSNLDEDMKMIEQLEQCLNSENHQPQDSADLLDVSETN